MWATSVCACECACVRVPLNWSVCACARGRARASACMRRCAAAALRMCGVHACICVSVCARICLRKSVCVRARMRARERVSLHACIRSFARASVFSRSIGKHLRERVACACVRACVCVRGATWLWGRCGARAGAGGINRPAAGRPRARGCGSVRSALGVARVRPQARPGRAVPSRRNGLRDIGTRP